MKPASSHGRNDRHGRMPFLVDSLGIVFGRSELADSPHRPSRAGGSPRRPRTDRRAASGRATAAATRVPTLSTRSRGSSMKSTARPIPRRSKRSNARSKPRWPTFATPSWIGPRCAIAQRSLVASLENSPPQPIAADDVAEARHLLSGWKHATLCFWAIATTRWSAARRKTGSSPTRAPVWASFAKRNATVKTGATVLRGDVRAKAREPELLILTKANSPSTVHRSEYLDYVGVKTFDNRGRVSGEHRFLGLWTSTAYHGSPRDIPVLRRKVERVVQYFGLDPQSHDGKAVSERSGDLSSRRALPGQRQRSDSHRAQRGEPYERRTVRLLVRRDPYHRFYSCLVYVPRDRYNTEVRQRIEQIVLEGFEGKVESNVQISGSNHARVHVVVRTDPSNVTRLTTAPSKAISRKRPSPGPTGCAKSCRAQRRGRGIVARTRYRRAFPMAYEEDVMPADALQDLADLEALREQAAGHAPQAASPGSRRKPERVHLKIVKLGDPVPISDLLPMLENFGLRVISERPYELRWPEGGAAWIQDFELEHRERLNHRRSRASRRTSRKLSPPPGAAKSRTTASIACCSAPASTRARSWYCAPTAATCCRPACRSARRTWSARWRPTPPSRATWCACSRRRFDPATAGKPRRSDRDADEARRRSIRSRARRGARASMKTASCARI